MNKLIILSAFYFALNIGFGLESQTVVEETTYSDEDVIYSNEDVILSYKQLQSCRQSTWLKNNTNNIDQQKEVMHLLSHYVNNLLFDHEIESDAEFLEKIIWSEYNFLIDRFIGGEKVKTITEIKNFLNKLENEKFSNYATYVLGENREPRLSKKRYKKEKSSDQIFSKNTK